MLIHNLKSYSGIIAIVITVKGCVRTALVIIKLSSAGAASAAGDLYDFETTWAYNLFRYIMDYLRKIL